MNRRLLMLIWILIGWHYRFLESKLKMISSGRNNWSLSHPPQTYKNQQRYYQWSRGQWENFPTRIKLIKLIKMCLRLWFRIIYFYYLFFHRRPTHKLYFLSCRSFVVNATFSTGLVVFSVSWNETQLVSGMTVAKWEIKINISNWNLPISAWNMIFKSIDDHDCWCIYNIT